MESENREDDEPQKDPRQTLTLALFDHYWFHRLVLFNLRRPPPPPPPPPATDVEDAGSRAASPANLLFRRRLSHRRSLSDDLTPSQTLHVDLPKLHTIPSGKEAPADDEDLVREEKQRRRRSRRDRRRRRMRRGETSKSMSELEFEELKGFMDLGFTFSDVEADPRLMEIVPGLQRLKAGDNPAAPAAEDEEESSVDARVSRPYLSEAWDAAEEEEEEEEEKNRLRVLTIPITGVGDGAVDLKDQLRFWAHAVASTVR